MNVLLAGLNNYLGKRLACYLADEGNKVFCLVRNETHFLNTTRSHLNIFAVRGDLIRERYAPGLPEELDCAIYLSQDTAEWNDEYRDMELLSLNNFVKQARRLHAAHLLYVTRLRTPFVAQAYDLLRKSYIHFTFLRISNIIGKDSVLLQMMENLSAKMVIFANQRLARLKAQPIALADLLTYISFLMVNPVAFDQVFDIGGTSVLSYREMLEKYLKMNKLSRKIIPVPDSNNELSAYIMSMTTGVSLEAARAMGEHITDDLLCEENKVHELFPHDCLSFEDALQEAMADDSNMVY